MKQLAVNICATLFNNCHVHQDQHNLNKYYRFASCCYDSMLQQFLYRSEFIKINMLNFRMYVHNSHTCMITNYSSRTQLVMFAKELWQHQGVSFNTQL